MELSPYVESVRRGVSDAAALADEHTRQVAERLGAGVGSAARLALIEALADAAGEISVELAPGSVELRMQGAEPTFVVTLPPSAAQGVTVSDAEALEAMFFAFAALKLVLEPGGAAPLAAVLARKVALEGRNTLVVCSGGNVDPAVFARCLSLGTERGGRA